VNPIIIQQEYHLAGRRDLTEPTFLEKYLSFHISLDKLGQGINLKDTVNRLRQL
jgi:hypothetical protein